MKYWRYELEGVNKGMTTTSKKESPEALIYKEEMLIVVNEYVPNSLYIAEVHDYETDGPIALIFGKE